MRYDDQNPMLFDLILTGLKANNEPQILDIIAHKTSDIIGIRAPLLLGRLTKVAGLSSAQAGIRLMDLHVSSLTRPFIVLAHLVKPVETGRNDGQPADIYAILLSPEHTGSDHLRTLARWSRLLRDAQFCSMLRSVRNADDVRALMANLAKDRVQAA